MFSYYGSKMSVVKHYPPPIKNTIIEPFAGSACYSLFYGCVNSNQNRLFEGLSVELYDACSVICGLWKYLINVKESEILKLPLLKPSEKIPTTLVKEAQNLIGFWCSKGTTRPVKTMTKRESYYDEFYWSEKVRARIANQIKYIRHWKVYHKSYQHIPNKQATWFIDPPYFVGGTRYKHNKINYFELAEFCKSRNGQVIVCENNHASWLPFKPFKTIQGTRKPSNESIWIKTNECN